MNLRVPILRPPPAGTVGSYDRTPPSLLSQFLLFSFLCPRPPQTTCHRQHYHPRLPTQGGTGAARISSPNIVIPTGVPRFMRHAVEGSWHTLILPRRSD